VVKIESRRAKEEWKRRKSEEKKQKKIKQTQKQRTKGKPLSLVPIKNVILQPQCIPHFGIESRRVGHHTIETTRSNI
jgi:hypothetical protein